MKHGGNGHLLNFKTGQQGNRQQDDVENTPSLEGLAPKTLAQFAQDI